MTNGKPPAPARVANIETWWTDPPPTPSARLLWWMDRIHHGWRPNTRIQTLGYYSSAQYYGVYLWEWLNVLSPLLTKVRALDALEMKLTASTTN